MSAAERLNRIESLHGLVIRGDDRVAEFTRLVAEHDAIPALAAALRAVLALHKRIDVQAVTSLDCCRNECDHESGCPTNAVGICAQCDERCGEGYAYYQESNLAAAEYPCPTREAIEQHLGGA